jgi:hypothetical protein
LTFVIGHGGENGKQLGQRSRFIGSAKTCAEKWGRDNRFSYLRAGSGIQKHGAGTTNAGVHQSLRPPMADAFYFRYGLNVERLPMDPIFYYNKFADEVTIHHYVMCLNYLYNILPNSHLFIYRYYGVDSQTVNWTSLVYMVVYVPLIFPGAWIMDKMVSLDNNKEISESIADNKPLKKSTT